MNLRNRTEKGIVFLLLTVNVFLAIYVRLIGASYDVTALEGTDAVRYVHQAKQIAEMGRMPEIDMLRSAPLGERTSNQLTFYPYVIATMYKLIDLIPVHVELEQLAIVLPIVFFVLTILSTYILVWRLFDNYTALLVVNIIAIVPPLLAKTAAGSADRDSIVLLLSTTSFFFYLLSYLNDLNKKKWLYRSLSACTMLLAELTWQGTGVFIAVVVTAELIRLLVDHSYSYKGSALFACWVLPVSLGPISLKPDVYSRLDQPYAFVAVLYPLFREPDS